MISASKDKPLFEATLYPHRSLPVQGFLLLLACVATVSFMLGLVFAASGAWPIFCFFGLDVLLLFIAFRMNYRAGRLFEHIQLFENEILIRRVHPNGRAQEWRMQPNWLQITTVPSSEALKAPIPEVRLRSHGRSIGIGRFLTNDERTYLADALKCALEGARTPNLEH
mgnify:CR=1 FL=1|tara:strand:- start:117 stop:620 length:504 start_codon:yes stop_codon:yes gene_type:complete